MGNSDSTCGQECTSCFSPSENDSLIGVSMFGALLSLLGSSFIIFSYYYFIQLRTFPYKIIMYLSVADCAASFSYLIGISKNDGAGCTENGRCTFAAVLNQFFGVASFMWTGVVAFNCYAVLVQQKGHSVEQYEKYYHAAAWGVSLLFAVIAGATDSYGDAGNWCWLKYEAELERLFLYYLPLLLMMIYVVIIYILISSAVRGSAQRATINFRLRLYLFVFVVIRFFSVINRLHDWASSEPVFALYFLQSMFEPLQGIGNAVVYGFNRQVAAQWRDLWALKFASGSRSSGALQSSSSAELPSAVDPAASAGAST